MRIWDRCKEQFVWSLINTARDLALPVSTALFMTVDSWKRKDVCMGQLRRVKTIPGNFNIIKLNYIKLIFNNRFWVVNFVKLIVRLMFET